MEVPRWLLTLVLLHHIQNKATDTAVVVAQTQTYRWACSEPDGQGLRYLPSVRPQDYGSNVLTVTTDGNVVNIYRARTLTSDCHSSGDVTAIEYCYQYNTTEPGEAVFNWRVLVLNEATEFTVTRVYVLESCPSSLGIESCKSVGEGKAECCDQTLIEAFDLENSLTFGVTKSAQGNTAGATLLGFFGNDTTTLQREYVVFTIQAPRSEGQTLSVGSTLPKPAGVQLGLRMLWFVIGNVPVATSSNTIGPTTASLATQTTTTRFNTEPTTTTTIAQTSTMQSSVTDFPNTTDNGIASTTSGPTLTQQSNSDFGLLVGSVIGGVLVLILLSAIAILILIVVYQSRKYKKEFRGREAKTVMAQNVSALDMEMNSNDCYSPTFCDSLETNVAYGGMTSMANNVAYSKTLHQGSNGQCETIMTIEASTRSEIEASSRLYESIIPIEASTRSSTQVCDNIETQNGEEENDAYDYID